MKFSDKYPNEEIYKDGSNGYPHFFKDTEKGPCLICGEGTNWIATLIEFSFICSEECKDKFWDEFQKACEESDKKYGRLQQSFS